MRCLVVWSKKLEEAPVFRIAKRRGDKPCACKAIPSGFIDHIVGEGSLKVVETLGSRGKPFRKDLKFSARAFTPDGKKRTDSRRDDVWPIVLSSEEIMRSGAHGLSVLGNRSFETRKHLEE